MVTSYNHVDKVMEARNPGANDFLIKLVSVKSVYIRIRSTMEEPQPFVRSENYLDQIDAGATSDHRRASLIRGPRDRPKSSPPKCFCGCVHSRICPGWTAY